MITPALTPNGVAHDQPLELVYLSVLTAPHPAGTASLAGRVLYNVLQFIFIFSNHTVNTVDSRLNNILNGQQRTYRSIENHCEIENLLYLVFSQGESIFDPLLQDAPSHRGDFAWIAALPITRAHLHALVDQITAESGVFWSFRLIQDRDRLRI